LNSNKKKIAAIFFILLGLSPLLFVLFISIKKEQIHYKMKMEFEKGALQTVVLPENKVVWMDKHEIWVNNSMFDIATKKLENGIYTFTGLYDEDETSLVEKEKESSEKNNEQDKRLSQLLKTLPIFCSLFKESYQFEKPCSLFFSFVPERHEKPFKKILVPPPQVYC